MAIAFGGEIKRRNNNKVVSWLGRRQSYLDIMQQSSTVTPRDNKKRAQISKSLSRVAFVFRPLWIYDVILRLS